MGDVLTFEQRVTAFWAKVNIAGPIPPLHPEMSNCWIWEGYREEDGYGRWMVPGEEKQKCVKAHRFSFFLLYGRWPDLELDHICHVRECVRQDHLREASRKENALNRAQKLCKRGHPLADPNLYYYGNGKRRCKMCLGMVNWPVEQTR